MRRKELLERAPFALIPDGEPQVISDYSSDCEMSNRICHVSQFAIEGLQDLKAAPQVKIPPEAVEALSALSNTSEARTESCPKDFCVIAATKGLCAPKFEIVEEGNTRMRWMHYRGFRQSPFLPLPDFLKKAITKWRQYAISPMTHVEPGKEPIKACHICRTTTEDPIAHKESEAHVLNVERLDWTEFQDLANQLIEERKGKAI
jgi:hypothetical protein